MSSSGALRRIWGWAGGRSSILGPGWTGGSTPHNFALPSILRHEPSALQEPLWRRCAETEAFFPRRTEGSPALPAPPPYHLQSSAVGTARGSLWEESVPRHLGPRGPGPGHKPQRGQNPGDAPGSPSSCGTRCRFGAPDYWGLNSPGRCNPALNVSQSTASTTSPHDLMYIGNVP